MRKNETGPADGTLTWRAAEFREHSPGEWRHYEHQDNEYRR